MTALSPEVRDLLDKIFVADEFKRITIKVGLGVNVWWVLVRGGAQGAVTGVCVGEWVYVCV